MMMTITRKKMSRRKMKKSSRRTLRMRSRWMTISRIIAAATIPLTVTLSNPRRQATALTKMK